MQNLTIDTGVQEFSVNGRGVLRFNPGDPNLYRRFFSARETLAQLDDELRAEAEALDARGDLPEEARAAEGLRLLARYDERIKTLLTGIFGPGNDFDALLEGVNLAAPAANGRRVVQNLLEALAPILRQGAEEAAATRARDAVAEADRRRADRGALPA